VTGARRERSGRPISRDGAIDQQRVAGGQRRVPEPGPFHDAGAKAFDEHLGLPDLLPEALPTSLGHPVKGDEPLAVMERLEKGLASRHLPERVSARGLDLQDLRPRVGQHPGAEAPRKQP